MDGSVIGRMGDSMEGGILGKLEFEDMGGSTRAKRKS